MKKELSFKVKPVKAHTLAFAPEDWFSVKDYLVRRAVDIDIKYLGVGNVFQLAEGRVPSEKTLSMRLLRYYRQGLLDRKRIGHKFLYKVTKKGRMRGAILKKPADMYDYLPNFFRKKKGKSDRIRSTLQPPKVMPSKVQRRGILDFLPVTCNHCGKPLPSPNDIVCPYCYKLVRGLR